MKLYRNLTEAVVQALGQIFDENKYADRVIEKVLKQNPKWGARDRRFIAETAYDIVRWFRLFQYAAECQDHEYWKLVAAWCIQKNINLPPWAEFQSLQPSILLQRLQSHDMPRAVRASIPDWMDELCHRELGDRWDVEIEALNKEAEVVLRVNTLKTTVEDLRHQLEQEQVVTHIVEGYPEALMLRQRQNIFRTGSFQAGLFEVQDAGSQAIASFLKVQPGHRVVDACAGAGGKTLHLAALMQNKGRIIAMDTELWKLDELKKRARRSGAANIETRVIESSKTVKRLARSADRLLLDVPCSGLGVLRRNPDAKWKLSVAFIERIKALQQTLLNDYSAMLKEGGLMVYSTCSLLPSENEFQVKAFLESHPEFELQEEKHIWPSEGFDGFYMARLLKHT